MLQTVKQPDGSLATIDTGSRTGVADNSKGVVVLSNKLYDIFTIPPVLSFTTASDNGVGAATATQYIFNNSVLNPLDTDNGSGANSIVNTYGDGFSGRVYNAMISSSNGGRGIKITGFTISATVTSTGAQTSTPFNTIQMQILNANGQGGSTPIPINLNAALRNTQFQVGILTVVFPATLNTLNQISVSLPANTTFAFTFDTETGTIF